MTYSKIPSFPCFSPPPPPLPPGLRLPSGLTSADFLIYQFKPSGAITFVAYHEVFADVRTAAIINQAFVYIWKKKGPELPRTIF